MAIEDRFNTIVSVEYDAASDGSITDDEGVASPVWMPIPGALERLPCLIYENESQRATSQDWGEDVTVCIMLFPANCGLPRDRTLRFKSLDDISGKTVYYYANGKPTSPGRAYVRVMARLGAIE